MTEDLLSRSRRLVTQHLQKEARKRMEGRELIGVKFDKGTRTWFVLLNGRWQPLYRKSMFAAPSLSIPPAKLRKSSGRPHSLKK